MVNVVSVFTAVACFVAAQAQVTINVPSEGQHICSTNVRKLSSVWKYDHDNDWQVKYREVGPEWAMVIFPYTKYAYGYKMKPNMPAKTRITDEGEVFVEGTLVPVDWLPIDGISKDLYFNLELASPVQQENCTCSLAAEKHYYDRTRVCNHKPELFEEYTPGEVKNCASCKDKLDDYKDNICQSAFEKFNLTESLFSDWTSFEDVLGGFSGPGLADLRQRISALFPTQSSVIDCSFDVRGLTLPQSGCSNFSNLPPFVEVPTGEYTYPPTGMNTPPPGYYTQPPTGNGFPYGTAPPTGMNTPPPGYPWYTQPPATQPPTGMNTPPPGWPWYTQPPATQPPTGMNTPPPGWPWYTQPPTENGGAYGNGRVLQDYNEYTTYTPPQPGQPVYTPPGYTPPQPGYTPPQPGYAPPTTNPDSYTGGEPGTYEPNEDGGWSLIHEDDGYAKGYGVNGANFDCGLSTWFKCREDTGRIFKIGELNFKYIMCPDNYEGAGPVDPFEFHPLY